MFTRFTLTLVTMSVASFASCRPPVEPPPKDGATAIDVSGFFGDVPAVGGLWYDYDPQTHVLSPRDETYVVRARGDDDSVRYAAVRVTSYYSDDHLESGFFTFERAIFNDNDGVWSTASTISLSDNVKDAPVCVDLFASGDGVEEDCDGDDWQLAFRTLARVIPEAGFAVREPGLFPKSLDGIAAGGRCSIATVSGSFDTLPDPSSIDDVNDASPSAWDTVPSFNHDHFAAAIPLAGQIVGGRFDEAQGDIVFLFTGHQTLARLAWSISSGGDIELSGSAAAVDLSTLTASKIPAPVTATVTLSADHPRALVRIDADAIVVDDSLLPASLSSFADEQAYDLELLLLDDGNPAMRLSPAAALYNATARDGATDLASTAPPSGA